MFSDPGLGSVRFVVDPANGKIAQEVEYDEYGNIMKSLNSGFQPLTFVSGLYDSDTKLIRFGARDYDPTVGRLMAKDPIGFDGGDSNLYAYAADNPLTFVDTKGTDTEILRDPEGVTHDVLHIYDPNVPGNSIYVGLMPQSNVKLSQACSDVPAIVVVDEKPPKGAEVLEGTHKKTTSSETSAVLSKALVAERQAALGQLMYNFSKFHYDQNSTSSNCRGFARGL